MDANFKAPVCHRCGATMADKSFHKRPSGHCSSIQDLSVEQDFDYRCVLWFSSGHAHDLRGEKKVHMKMNKQVLPEKALLSPNRTIKRARQIMTPFGTSSCLWKHQYRAKPHTITNI
jgi:hypothetical protein